MTAKYKQDAYLAVAFDEYGGKIFTEPCDKNLTDSIKQGRQWMESGDCASFAIMRVLHNSIDSAKGDRWMPKQGDDS
ncbi:MAG: hypothetical protein ACR2IJ_11500 [Fluviibacter sp.]